MALNPTAALSTQRPDLAESFAQFDQALAAYGYIGAELFPPVDVAQQAGNFGVIPIQTMIATIDTTRAPGAGYNRGQGDLTPKTYSCLENGAEDVIDDREANMYRNYFDGEQMAAIRARDRVLRNYEIRIAAKFVTGNFGSGFNSAVAVSWKTIASSTPAVDIVTAKKAIYANSGLVANAVAMSWKKWLDLQQSDDLINRIKYAGLLDPQTKTITTAAAAAYFDVDQVLIAGAPKITSNEGATVALGSIWTDDTVFVGRIGRTSDFKEPCIGRTFNWTEDGGSMAGAVESYRDENVRSNVVRVRMDTDENLIYKSAGYLLTGADA